MKNRNERRKNQRFGTRNGSYAVLKDDVYTNEKKLGRIVDISDGGFSLACIQADVEDHIIQASQVDIFRETEEFYLLGIPCTILRTDEVKADFPLNSMAINKYCIQFGELTEFQQMQLDYFINRFTTKSFANLERAAT